MHRLLTSTAVAVATLAATATITTAAASAAPPEARACGALKRTRVIEIEATVVTCRFARELATRHERSVRRGGACRIGARFCAIGRFQCVYPFGTTAPIRVLCAERGDRKVVFSYRAAR